ncbi:MAG: phosphoribosylformylglycinamidine cyclo-ligase [Rhodanobacteraceae bacterium]
MVPSGSSPRTPLSYRDAGVDIDAGDALVERIKPYALRTMRPEVLAGIGGFGGLVEIGKRFREPVLVAGTDGVGTKLKLAFVLGRHDSVGIDLVAMSVNDILVQGAEPLFFLDYFACGKLDVDVAADVIKGIAAGCEQAGCALIGGETAEMPGMYADGEYDLAGFAVGVVEKRRIIDGRSIAAGDAVLGLASSGPHSNGFSLIRRIVERVRSPFDLKLDDGQTLADALMTPTTIYVKPILQLLRDFQNRSGSRVPNPESRVPVVHGMAHITGGGLVENIIRVVPDGLGLAIDASAWKPPAVFDWLQREGKIAREEMWRTFNCGIGFTLILAPHDVDAVKGALAESNLAAWPIGEVVATSDRTRVRIA